jgi:hypothetical protein
VTPGEGLRELLAAEHDRGYVWQRGELANPQPQPAPPATRPLVIEPPDWEQEAAERAQREHQPQKEERNRIVAEELARPAAVPASGYGRSFDVKKEFTSTPSTEYRSVQAAAITG